MDTRNLFAIIYLVLSLGAGLAGAETRDGAQARPYPEDIGLAPLDSLPADPGLQDYSRLALARNDRLQGARAFWQAKQVDADGVGALPDPRFTWSEAIEPVQTRVGPQERILTLSQQIPWFGTLGLRRDVADEQAAAAAAGVRQVALDILHQVQVAYHELAYLDVALEIAGEHLALLRQWERTARTRYETGAGSYADLVKTQVELGVLEDRLAGMQDRRRPLTATFNAAVGRPVATPVELKPVADGDPVLDPEDLQARLAAMNPALVSLRHDATGQLKTGELAGKRRLPDLNLGVRYIQIGEAPVSDSPGSGQDAWFASLSVNLPLWQGSYGATEKAANGYYRAVEHNRADLLQRLTARLEQAVYEYRDADRQLSLYRDTLLPKGRQALAAARAAYETGTAGFLSLIDAQRMLLEFELSGRRAETDRRLAVADVENLIGGPLTGVPAAVSFSLED